MPTNLIDEEAISPAINNNDQVNNSDRIVELDAPLNGKVYLVGTAHFSPESNREVAELIKRVKPNRVVIELCQDRSHILKLDEETVLRDAKDLDMNKIMQMIRQTSVAHGLLQALMVRMYARITQELGLAPGGEFRAAYKEAQQIPNCQLILGDMPIKLTLSRGFNSLPWYRKLKLGFMLLFTDFNLTQEDIEALKKTDILEMLTKEFGDQFPEFKRVLIDERDMYLTSSLRDAYKPIPDGLVTSGFSPAIVVGVVGLGHIKGIQNNWNKKLNLEEILKKTGSPELW
jgi:pheromone shutdown protein TraB